MLIESEITLKHFTGIGVAMALSEVFKTIELRQILCSVKCK